MINKLEISGVHAKLDKETKTYTQNKVGRLDKYLPKSARASAHAEVRLAIENQKARKLYVCEVVLYLPHQELVVKEKAANFITAVDGAEAKLKVLLKKYKGRHGRDRLHHKLIGKIRRR
ncbi:ribosomal subunit interface protein [Candidatus Saccharibacteria bacterium RIFCSPHIGHO2_02_FULL_47_12]|nr:MAG: ribosomal subunit interface protein [Candidatus Saccharibacteria bacterium RIFCSPHIGHO2_02_FULL_47_12]